MDLADPGRQAWLAVGRQAAPEDMGDREAEAAETSNR